jgi:hypothetical protein
MPNPASPSMISASATRSAVLSGITNRDIRECAGSAPATSAAVCPGVQRVLVDQRRQTTLATSTPKPTQQTATTSQGRVKVMSIYCGLPDIRQAVGPGWMGLRTDRQYADQPD